ncbi:hypothetical protein RJ639_006029 [Escallonia herrerae]|uniref:Uncharacterized protein n=1 Tax=Escallonia herrerae TaxID=1293975 RepID=A0AA88VVD8_9ASTE|nr:hypothetical protein RJ639_006029 [Escallonia herrerae]
MDESWRMRMGPTTSTRKQNPPHRRSTEDTSRRSAISGDSATLCPEDFNDVFGGPPRSVMTHHFPGGTDVPATTFFYEEIFRKTEGTAAGRNGRSLPEFRIPASGGDGGGRRNEEFYSDIFGKDVEGLRRSRSRSKANSVAKSRSNSSSVLSSEDFSPFRSAVADDDLVFASFASKLRPLNFPKWNSSTIVHEGRPRKQGVADFSCNHPSFVVSQENDYEDNFKGSSFGLSRRISSPETISHEPNSYGSVKISVDDIELNSPSSAVSSICQDQYVKANKVQDEGFQEQSMEEEEDEVMSSYVIEINSNHRVGSSEALAIDDAIAWAKEKCQRQSAEKDWSRGQHEKEESAETANPHDSPDEQTGRYGSMQSPEDNSPSKCAREEENEELKRDIEMELLDEDVKLWSDGKEANIQLLLSTLHHILWPNSGWRPIPLTNLKESSHVKKAYQKARLCLHPDKLQQRGATLPQKYIADKAFPILQDAWAAFISEDTVHPQLRK